ncbi:MAG: DNA primase, partial [Arenibacterium sp.]
IAPEPIIALDGDTAGLRAAVRLIDLALPMLEGGRSLRFALMPEGQDPDDLLRAEGPSAIQKRLDAALPMVRLLWQRETEGRVFDSPERKAALDKALRDKIKLIRDPSIRAHYGQEIKNLRWELFSPRKGANTWQPRSKSPVALPSTRNSMLVAAGDQAQIQMREAVILATLISTPDVLDQFEAGVERMECMDPNHAMLRDMVLRFGGTSETLRGQIEAESGPEPLENLFALRHVALNPAVRRPGDVEIARLTLAEELAKLQAQSGLNAEIADAVEDLDHVEDEALTWRLGQAAEAAQRAMRSQNEDKAEYDRGENGARINRDEREAFQALLDQIGHPKEQH